MRFHKKGNIAVSGLPRTFTDEQLAKLFDDFGLVLRASLHRKPDGTVANYGIVDLAPIGAMAKAIAALNGSMIEGCRIKVTAAEQRQTPATSKRNDPPGKPPVDRTMTHAQFTPRAPRPAGAEPRRFVVEYRSHGIRRPPPG